MDVDRSATTPAAWMVLGLATIIGVLLYFVTRYLRARGRMKSPTMTFEFGDTERGRVFVTSNPKVVPLLFKLIELTNKCFGRAPRSQSQLEHICFWLGHACREDFVEIVFLAVNGYGSGATKILRSLYERAVTIGYLLKHPEKVERFVRFAPLQEHRALDAALKAGLTESQIDATLGPPNTVAEIRARFKECKDEFKAKTCGVCGVRTPPSWDIDLASMVKDVGEPYLQMFVLAYTSPNFLIHATLASASPPDEGRQQMDAKTALTVASAILIAVVETQNELFHLKLNSEIKDCGKDLLHLQADELRGSPASAH